MMRARGVSGAKVFLLMLALLLSSQSRAAYGLPGPGAAGTIDWLKPTGGPYPMLEAGARLWIKVSLERQRVYIVEGQKTLYTMIASTGLDSPADDRTPEGTFFIQRERGLSFYSPKESEGARYWVSWLHHGEYLFHSVPTDKKGNIIANEARKLGTKASHGCIRLSLPDAKWIYDTIPLGTKVVIGP